MPFRLWVVGLSALSMVACSFDVSLPVEAVIACDETLRCPPGLVCRPDLQRCVEQDNPDRDAPRLLDATLNGTTFTRGQTLTLALTASEPFGIPPRARIVFEHLTLPLELLTVDDAETPHAQFQLPVDAAAPEGSGVVLADLVDRAGNSALSLAIGSARFDFSAPVVTRVAFVTPRHGDGGTIEVRADEEVTVNVVLSEEVRRQGALRALPRGCDGGVVALSLFSGTEATLDFLARAPGGEPGCSYQLELSEVADRAGNALAPTLLDAHYTVVGLGPPIEALRATRQTSTGRTVATVFSRQPAYQSLALEFDVGPTAVSMSVQLDDGAVRCSLSDCQRSATGFRCLCPRPLTATDAEGLHVFAVTSRDSAGNTFTASTPVRFDFTAPALVPNTTTLTLTPPAGSVLARVSALGPGASARLSFTVDEPLKTDPLVVVTPAGLAFTKESGSSTAFSFVASVDQTIASGTRTLELLVVDDVDNGARLSLTEPLEVVITGPTAPMTTADSGVTYVRAPWGDGVQGPFFSVIGPAGSVPSGMVVRALDGPDLATASELGRGLAGADGAFSVSLARSDRAAVYLTVVDSAGNESPASDVKAVEWHAVMRGKVVGSTLQNPHTYETRPSFFESFSQLEAAQRQTEADAVAELGGSTVETTTAWRWVQRAQQTRPGNRLSSALAYDERRRRLVLYGGSSGLSDTWEFDGTQWVRRTPLDFEGDGNPPALGQHAMAYDAARGRVVLYGGEGLEVGFSNQLWEWDGQSWIRRLGTASAPGQRYAHAMAYDATREQVVLLDGTSSGLITRLFFGWNGDQWSGLPGDSSARPINSGMFAFDAARDCLVSLAEAVGETWEWCGASPTWTLKNQSSAMARRNGAMTYDPVARKVVVVGGGSTTDATIVEWSGTAWTTRPMSGGGPLIQSDFLFAYDQTLNALTVLSAGSSGTLDHWVLRSTGWQRLSVPAALPFGSPEAQFDSARGVVVVAHQSNPWAINEWNGQSWRSIDAGSTLSESVRNGYNTSSASTPDAGFLLFTSNSGTLRTYQWTGSSWVARTPAVAPNASGLSPSTTYDPVTQKVWLLAGTVDPSFSTSWTFSGGAYTSLGAGPGLLSAAMGADPVRQRVVLFGGQRLNLAVGETLEWSGTDWVPVAPLDPEGDGNPGVRSAARLVWVPEKNGLVLFGGSGAGADDAVWVWNGRSWRNESPLGPSPGRAQFPGLAYDPLRRQVVLAGSSSNNASTWTLGLEAGERPAHLFKVAFGAAEAGPDSVVEAVRLSWVAGGSGGLQLLGYERNSFLPLAVSSATVPNPRTLSWSTEDGARINRLFFGQRQELLFALTTQEVTTTAPVTMTADAVEAVVRYVRP